MRYIWLWFATLVLAAAGLLLGAIIMWVLIDGVGPRLADLTARIEALEGER